MTVEQVIRYFGGVNATARQLKIKQPAVSQWRRKGKVPKLRQYQIEQFTDGKLKADGK